MAAGGGCGFRQLRSAALTLLYEFLQWSTDGEVSSLLAAEPTRSESRVLMPLETVAEAHALSAAIFTRIQAASPSFPSASRNSEWATDNGPTSCLLLLEQRKSPNLGQGCH